MSRKNLLTHLKNLHEKDSKTDDIIPKIKRTRISCPHETCREELFTFNRQRSHLLEKHGLVEHDFGDMAGNVIFIFCRKLVNWDWTSGSWDNTE